MDKAKEPTLYGLIAEFPSVDELLAAQGGRCLVCGTDDPPKAYARARWHVDHDHKCCPPGKSCDKCRRGVLCGPCNSGLGMFGDDIERLRGAIAYLEMFAGMNASGSATNMGATVSRSTPAL